jgi:hypothetical protein
MQLKLQTDFFKICQSFFFDDIINPDIKSCESCWWASGRPSEERNKGLMRCSLYKKDKEPRFWCASWREKFTRNQ